jgi:hypothetical protein
MPVLLRWPALGKAMQSTGTQARCQPAIQITSGPLRTATLLAFAFTAALILISILYGPALHSPFVFDDNHLPFRVTSREEPLAVWLNGVRPVLMLTYWANYKLGGDDPVGYHAFNLLIHAANSLLTFLILFRLLTMAGWAG